MYCGCGTGGNRLRWLVFLLLFIVAAVMAVVYCLEAKQCRYVTFLQRAFVAMHDANTGCCASNTAQTSA